MWARIGCVRAIRMVCLAILMAISASGRAEAGKVRGTVVDREGKPAAGAKVWIAKIGYLEPLEAHEATADGSGAFSIAAGPGTWGVFAVRGEEGGRVGWDSIPHVENGKDPAPVTVQLGPPTILKGRLLDAETGKPIASGSFALDDARRLPVDAQGRFEAPGLALTNHEAYPLCPGYERKRILFDTTGQADAQAGLEAAQGGEGRRPRRRRARQADPGRDRRAEDVGLDLLGVGTLGAVLRGRSILLRRQALGPDRRLSARAPGYQDLERTDVVAFDASNPVQIDFVLHPDPTKGPAAKVAAKAMNRRTVSGTVVGPDGKPVASGRGALGPASQQRQRSRDEDRRPGDVSPGRGARFARMSCR